VYRTEGTDSEACEMYSQNSDNLSEQFATSVRLRQGDVLSCLLFNLEFENLVKDLEIETNGYIYIYICISQC
jgi:hypothetical protein